MVYDALKKQELKTRLRSKYLFLNPEDKAEASLIPEVLYGIRPSMYLLYFIQDMTRQELNFRLINIRRHFILGLNDHNSNNMVS
jgi:hypothetical protein